MTVDYAGLYGTNYFAHATGRASFKPDFADAVAAFVRQQGLAGVRDIAGGNGLLAERLRATGIATRTFDYRPDPAQGVAALDLTQPIAEATVAAAREGWGGACLTTCLDALEHIAPRDIWAALHALSRLADDWLLVTISHRPSSRFNRFHAAILPPETWVAMLRTAGFDLVALDQPPFAKPDRPAGAIADPLIANWVRLNPFRMPAPHRSSCMLLRRRAAVEERAAFQARFVAHHPTIGDALHRVAAPARKPAGRVLALIDTLQMRSVMAPVLGQLSAAQVTIGLRGIEAGGDAVEIGITQGWAAQRGLETTVITDPVAWVDAKAEPGAMLLLAREGTFGHAGAYGSLVAARAREIGVPAVLLQHGIHVTPPARRPMLHSHHVLAWSAEHEAALRRAGLLAPPRFRVTGAPKLDLCGHRADLAAHLGPWVRAYARVAVIAANTHWVMHGEDAGAQLARLAAITRRHPDWLFLWKLHVKEDIGALAAVELGANVQLLDEAAMVAMDLPFQSVLAAADALVATQSTALLDSALAGCPVAMIDTRHPAPYADMQALQAEALRLPDSTSAAAAFRDRHLDPATRGRGTALTLEAMADIAAAGTAPDAHWAPVTAIGELWLDAYQTRAARRQEAEQTPAGAVPLLAAPGVRHRIEHGNPQSVVTDNRVVVLRANPAARPAPALVVEGLSGRDHGAVTLDAACPVSPTRLRAQIGGDAAVILRDPAPGAGAETITLALPEADGLSLRLEALLPPGAEGPGGARLRLTSLALIRRAPAPT